MFFSVTMYFGILNIVNKCTIKIHQTNSVLILKWDIKRFDIICLLITKIPFIAGKQIVLPQTERSVELLY